MDSDVSRDRLVDLADLGERGRAGVLVQSKTDHVEQVVALLVARAVQDRLQLHGDKWTRLSNEGGHLNLAPVGARRTSIVISVAVSLAHAGAAA